MLAICALVAMFLGFQLAEADKKGLRTQMVRGFFIELESGDRNATSWNTFLTEEGLSNFGAIGAMCALEIAPSGIVTHMQTAYTCGGAGTWQMCCNGIP